MNQKQSFIFSDQSTNSTNVPSSPQHKGVRSPVVPDDAIPSVSNQRALNICPRSASLNDSWFSAGKPGPYCPTRNASKSGCDPSRGQSADVVPFGVDVLLRPCGRRVADASKCRLLFGPHDITVCQDDYQEDSKRIMFPAGTVLQHLEYAEVAFVDDLAPVEGVGLVIRLTVVASAPSPTSGRNTPPPPASSSPDTADQSAQIESSDNPLSPPTPPTTLPSAMVEIRGVSPAAARMIRSVLVEKGAALVPET